MAATVTSEIVDKTLLRSLHEARINHGTALHPQQEAIISALGGIDHLLSLILNSQIELTHTQQKARRCWRLANRLCDL